MWGSTGSALELHPVSVLPSGGPGGCTVRGADRGVPAGEGLLPGAVSEENPGEGLLTRRLTLPQASPNTGTVRALE